MNVLDAIVNGPEVDVQRFRENSGLKSRVQFSYVNLDNGSTPTPQILRFNYYKEQSKHNDGLEED
jgi:hypothetical protein